MGEIMHVIVGLAGLALWGVAAYFLRVGLSISVAVASPHAPPGFDGVANLQLMHIQALDVHIGLAAGLAGTIMICTALIMWRIPSADS
jgi:hypothetical protein